MNPPCVEKWLCSSCKCHLGFVEDRKVVRIKRKDLYVEVEGGRVTETCPRCGKRNVLEDSKGEEVISNGV